MHTHMPCYHHHLLQYGIFNTGQLYKDNVKIIELMYVKWGVINCVCVWWGGWYFQGSWTTSLTAVVMATSAWRPVVVSAMKAGLGRTAQSPFAQWAAQAVECVWTVSVFALAIIVGKIAQKPAAWPTAVLEDSAWMDNASAKKVLLEKTVASLDALVTAQGRGDAPMGLVCAKKAMWGKTVVYWGASMPAVGVDSAKKACALVRKATRGKTAQQVGSVEC